VSRTRPPARRRARRTRPGWLRQPGPTGLQTSAARWPRSGRTSARLSWASAASCRRSPRSSPQAARRSVACSRRRSRSAWRFCQSSWSGPSSPRSPSSSPTPRSSARSASSSPRSLARSATSSGRCPRCSRPPSARRSTPSRASSARSWTPSPSCRRSTRGFVRFLSSGSDSGGLAPRLRPSSGRSSLHPRDPGQDRRARGATLAGAFATARADRWLRHGPRRSSRGLYL